MTTQDREQRVQYLRAIFDAVPLPSFIVDADVRIRDFNTAAEQLLGSDGAAALDRRGGEALHCLNAEPRGCGQAAPCGQCIIRTSIAKAMAGRSTYRQMHHAQLNTPAGSVSVSLLVTAALLPYTASPRAILILEDVAQTARLISGCRKRTGKRPGSKTPPK